MCINCDVTPKHSNITDGGVLVPLYDADGNLTNYNGWTFTWDAENRLIAAVNGSTVVSNQYDYMSRRISKASGGVTRMYVYDGWNLVQEAIGTSTNNYIWGLDLSGSLQGAGGIGGLLSANLNGTQAFYFYDANGNVSDLAGVSGNNLAHYEYDPYGNITASDYSLASANPFRFSSKYTDDETGLLYYGYRFYSPTLGRWLSRDPIGEKERMLYMFDYNAPTDYVDSLGLYTLATAQAPFSFNIVWGQNDVVFDGKLDVSVDDGNLFPSSIYFLKSTLTVSIRQSTVSEWIGLTTAVLNNPDFVRDWTLFGVDTAWTENIALAFGSSINGGADSSGYVPWNTAAFLISDPSAMPPEKWKGWTSQWSGTGYSMKSATVVGALPCIGDGKLRAQFFYVDDEYSMGDRSWGDVDISWAADSFLHQATLSASANPEVGHKPSSFIAAHFPRWHEGYSEWTDSSLTRKRIKQSFKDAARPKMDQLYYMLQ